MMDESNVTSTTITPHATFYKSYIERQIIATLIAIIAITGFCGNSLVILAVILSRKLRTYTNAFVVNLAVADLLTCAFLPWTVIATLSENGWPLAPIVCVLDGFCLITCLGCSINTLACIAINRRILITKSRQTYSWLYTPRKIAAMISLSWIYPFAISMIPLVSDCGELGYDYKTSSCTWNSEHSSAALYANIVGLSFYPIQLTTIIYSYIRIFSFTRGHTRKIAASSEPQVPSVAGGINSNNVDEPGVPLSKEQKKRLFKRQINVTKNLFYVVCAFLICVTPYIGTIVSQAENAPVVYCAVILISNSCVNFFVYATKHPDFKQVFRCIFLCQTSAIPEKASFIHH